MIRPTGDLFGRTCSLITAGPVIDLDIDADADPAPPCTSDGEHTAEIAATVAPDPDTCSPAPTPPTPPLPPSATLWRWRHPQHPPDDPTPYDNGLPPEPTGADVNKALRIFEDILAEVGTEAERQRGGHLRRTIEVLHP